MWLRSRAAPVSEIPPPVHTEDEVRARFREVVLLECEVWVADDDVAVATNARTALLSVRSRPTSSTFDRTTARRRYF